MKIVFGKKNGKNSKNSIYYNSNNFQITSEVTAFEKAIELTNHLESTNLWGKKIYELFYYGDVSMWWFMFPNLIQSIKSSINFIFQFEKIITEHNPEIIELVDEFDKFDVIKQICSKYNIKFEYSKSKYLLFLIKNEIINYIQSIRFKKITKNKIKQRLRLTSKKSKFPISNKILFLVPNTYRRKIFNLSQNSSSSGEFLVQPIIELLIKQNEMILGIDVDYSFKGDVDTLKHRLDDIIDWIPIESLIDLDLNQYTTFFKNYSNIITKQEFQKEFCFNEINFWNKIRGDFIKLTFYPHLPIYLLIIDSLIKIFQQQKPKAIFLPYETGPYALATIVGCRQNKIKTIGLQHGIIFGSNPDYSHTNFQSVENPLGMILPDYFLTFGNSAKDILLKNKNYPEEKIIVFGHPMYLNLHQILTNLDKKRLRSKFGIPNNKVILFMTGRYQSYYPGYDKQNYDEKILLKLIENFKNKEEFSIILKPHPIGEYLGFYKQKIDDNKCTNFFILNEDLFELLTISDLIISTFSTSLIDSIAFKKLVILVRFDSIVPYPFNQYEVVLDTELISLEHSIKQILSDPILQEKLFQNGEKFIEHQYNITNPNYLLQLKKILE